MELIHVYLACIRHIVSNRLHDLGLRTIRLPLATAIDKPHVPVLVSKNLSTASRVVVVFGESIQDLGIWAYRTAGKEGINQGSAVAFAKAILGKNDTASHDLHDRVALVLANTGQLIWHCGSHRAVTHATWLGMPRESAVEEPVRMTHRNKIPRNANWQEHVACVFEDILGLQGDILNKDARIDIVGVAEGGLGAIQYLANNCTVSLSLFFLYIISLVWVMPTNGMSQGTPGKIAYLPSASPTLFTPRVSTYSPSLRNPAKMNQRLHHLRPLFPLAVVPTFSRKRPLAFQSQVSMNMAATATHPGRR